MAHPMMGVGQWLGAAAMLVMAVQMTRRYLGIRAQRKRNRESTPGRRDGDGPTPEA